MASDYTSVRADNERRYGTDIGRIGRMLLADRYDDRTHFIFELLQNAEDALARRPVWEGSRAVNFALSESALRVSHSGKPFDDRDVRGICGIAESTKDLTAIGRFGIGFKSVYACTDRPEVHSGAEDFAIESFVWPTAAPRVDRGGDETIIVLPLNACDDAVREEIAGGLQQLGLRTLLFLRQIEEIAWSVEGGPSGLYRRSKPEAMGENVRRITVTGQEESEPNEETWLVFSREATTDEGAVAGHVEIAFSIAQEQESHRWSVQTVSDSPLVVFFPTVLQTHLGFLVQGPYRTTPSRDNVSRSDPWNQCLVEGTAALLVEALRWLRDHDMLDTTALRCLPLDPARFGKGSRFAPLFEATRTALATEPLLPRFGGNHVPASEARLARTQDLRELFSPSQLGTLFSHVGTLFSHDGELAWLSSDITQDRTPELRQYLMRELGITEVTPETILPRLDGSFLKAQPDGWILDLYEFLNGQPALRRRLNDLPLIRLEDGAHVPVRSNGQPQAFLPGAIETGFPTVRRAVCATDEARKFLQSLGITEPDPVDDVVRNVLPGYQGDEVDVVDVDDVDYDADIRRILAAFATDSKGQREKLLASLRESFFVMAVDAGNGSKWVSKPGAVYLATQRLKELFEGVSDVLLVDDAYSCLRGEDVRDLLEACGATRYLRPLRVEVTWEKRQQLRERAEAIGTRSEEHIEDYSIHGLELLLRSLPTLELSQQRQKTDLLWEALSDLEQRQRSVFTGTYRGQYYGPRRCDFEPAFIELLRGTAWVLDANGNLQQPEFVVFDRLGWKPNPFLLSKIRFKPPIIESLAKEAGIEPGALDLLKKLGLTSEADLRTWLGVEDHPATLGATEPDDVSDTLEKPPGDSPEPTAPMPGLTGSESPGSGGDGRDGSRTEGGTGSRGGGGTHAGTNGGTRTAGRTQDTSVGKRTPGSTSGRPFISYIGVHLDEDDHDGLDQQDRMALEENAIQLILSREPQLKRMPTHNPGYDLLEASDDGQPARWIEVKAMSGSLSDRPVGLSRTQFESAREHREAYWLYVVEHADDNHSARIVRIQDPAGKARTFTFDHGWLDVAEVDGTAE
ncbi:hypothetical protein NKDENANG_01639 [Candidatus Entotheonellaceae bacterium PAL068K]